MTLKEKVKQLCKDNGISMKKAERDLHFGVGYLSKLDLNTPSAKNLQAIADYFGIPVSELSDLVPKREGVTFVIPRDNPISRYLNQTVQTDSFRIAKEIIDKAIEERFTEPSFRDDELELLSLNNELNDEGRTELLKYARLLLNSPMYRKGEMSSASEKEA